MIYILIAAVVLLIVNLVLSVYILNKINLIRNVQVIQDEFLNGISNKQIDMTKDIRKIWKLNQDHFEETNLLIVDVGNTILDNNTRNAKDINQNHRHEMEAIESYMDISKNTLIEICDKLKKPEIDIVPVAKAYDVLAVAFDSETNPEVDWEPLIKQALVHLGSFLIENDEEESDEEIHD